MEADRRCDRMGLNASFVIETARNPDDKRPMEQGHT